MAHWWVDRSRKVELALEALKHGLCLEFDYHGHSRMVEVHTVGVTTAGRPAMCSYQVDGGTSSSPIPDWRLFCFDECINVRLSAAGSNAPRAGYRRGAKQFQTIIAEV